MNEASSALLLELKRITTTLNHAQYQISSQLDSNTISPSSHPQKLLERIATLQAQFERLSEEANELEQRKGELAKSTITLLIENNDAQNELSKRIGMKDLKNPFERESLDEEGEKIADDAVIKLREQMVLHANKNVVNEDNQKEKKNAVNPASLDVTPSSLSLTYDEFLSLSSNVKGRAKIEDCNNVLRYLVNVYNESGGNKTTKSVLASKNTNSISPCSVSSAGSCTSSVAPKATCSIMQMNAAGLKVTGLTGNNVLRSLEKLGRIKVDSKEVRLVVE